MLGLLAFRAHFFHHNPWIAALLGASHTTLCLAPTQRAGCHIEGHVVLTILDRRDRCFEGLVHTQALRITLHEWQTKTIGEVAPCTIWHTTTRGTLLEVIVRGHQYDGLHTQRAQ